MEYITNDKWFVDIELEVTIHTTQTHCYIIAHYLAADHC